MKTTKLTRQQFYELVWSTPMRTLAARFSTYDVALSQICKSHNIPRPPVGYWAQREVGKAPPTPPLPAAPKEWMQNIEIRAQPRPAQVDAPPIQLDADVVELLTRAKSIPKIEVADTLPRKLHPLLSKARDRLAESRIDDEGMVSSSHYQETNVEIWVTKASVRRSLLFMDALFRGIGLLGGEVRIEKLHDWRSRVTTVVRLAGERVTSIRLRERYKQVKEPPDPKRSWSYPSIKHVPTGRLVLDRGPSYSDRPHCEDSEKTGLRIEDHINRLLIAWVETAGRDRIKARNEAEEKRRREEAERLRVEQEADRTRRRDDLLREQKTEQAKVDQLLLDARRWRESRLIRRFLRALEDSSRREHALNDEKQAWLGWARDQAARLDPLAASPPSILDRRLDEI